MTIEEKLKEHILDNYKSIREFVKIAGLPYTTVDGILKRGIANSSIGNVLKICKALNISADELANNKIVPNTQAVRHVIISELPDWIIYIKKNVDEYRDLTVDKKPMTHNEIEILLDAMDMGIRLIKRHRERSER